MPCKLVEVAAYLAALGKQSGNSGQGFFSAACNDDCFLDPDVVDGTADKSCLLYTSSGDGLGRKALEVGVAVGTNRGICRKQTGENVTLAPHQCKYGAAEH